MTSDRARHSTDRPRSERGVPHDLDAERSTLGAAILRPSDLETLVRETRVEDFYHPLHRRVRRALEELYHASDEPFDHVAVAALLEDQDQGALVGILADAGVGTARNAERIHDLATKRRLLSSATQLSELATDRAVDAHQAVERAQGLVDDLTANNGSRRYSSLVAVDFVAAISGDVEEEEPVLLRRTDGQALLYPGKMHSLTAEPSAGKSWLALTAALEVLIAGGAVVYIDFEDSAGGIAGRLRKLAAATAPDLDLAEAATRFVYLDPEGPLGPAERHDLHRQLDRLNPDLVILDGIAEALAKDGYDEDRNAEVAAWIEVVPRPIARTGACVLMLDHVIKSKEGRGRGGRGAGHKLAAVDGASYQLNVTRPFSRYQDGSVVLKIDKDRPGAVGPIGGDAGTMMVKPRDHGRRVEVEIVSPNDPSAVPDPAKPTRLMVQAMRALEDAQTELSRRSLRAMLSGQASTKDAALEHLIAGGYVEEVTRGRSKVLVVRKTYSPVDNLDEDDLEDRYPDLFTTGPAIDEDF